MVSIKLRVQSVKIVLRVSFSNRKFHQQYVNTLNEASEKLFLVGRIDQKTSSVTFRGEFFFTPELSLQYYGSPYYSVGEYSGFNRVDQASSRDLNERLSPLDVAYDPVQNSYSFDYNSETWSFDNPDFSFMQFRSNLVFRWEYKLGSTLYFVWAHDRSGWESLYNPISDIAGDLFGVKVNHVFMFKMNFWFSA